MPEERTITPDDWTVKDGVSNSSDEFTRLCGEVAGLIRGGGGSALSHAWVDSTARLIMAQLAHVHHLAPLPQCDGSYECTAHGRHIEGCFVSRSVPVDWRG